MLPINKMTTGSNHDSNRIFTLAPVINSSENAQEVFSPATLIRAVEEKDLIALRSKRIENSEDADQAMKRAIKLGLSEVQQVLLEQMPDHNFFDCLDLAMERATHPNSSFVKQIMNRISDEQLSLQVVHNPKENFKDSDRNAYRHGLNVTAIKKKETDFLSRIISLTNFDDIPSNLPVIYKSNQNISPEIKEILLQMDSVFFIALETAMKDKNEKEIEKLLSDTTRRNADNSCIYILDYLWNQNDELNELRLKNYIFDHVNKIYGEYPIKTILKQAAKDGNIVKIEKVTDLFIHFFDRFINAGWTKKMIKNCIDIPLVEAKTSDVCIALLDLQKKTASCYPENPTDNLFLLTKLSK